MTTLGQLVRATSDPWLIGVGYGIGNMLHAGPMIRAIVRQTGHPVDLVVAGDNAGCRFLLQHPDYVGTVYSLSTEILTRRYATVFLSHFFLPFKVPFAAPRVLWSRDWDLFQPGVSDHETRFNLRAASALLGTPWETRDLTQHYVADIVYERPACNLVGFHAGSKTGHWTAKRWPGFARLAEALRVRGYRVASFGLPDEYVPGTENRTGGTVEEMVRAITACSYFVANDSGVMNLANALGIPLLALFGPTDVATRRPLAPTSMTLAVGTYCAPCEVTDAARFRSGKCRCLAQLSSERVLAAFDTLARKWPAPAARPLVAAQ
ncbi:MAG: glycosyltransferase family 9 protein [Pseudomonadota bacterium]